jgi:hypothetical protein
MPYRYRYNALHLYRVLQLSMYMSTTQLLEVCGAGIVTFDFTEEKWCSTNHKLVKEGTRA